MNGKYITENGRLKKKEYCINILQNQTIYNQNNILQTI